MADIFNLKIRGPLFCVCRIKSQECNEAVTSLVARVRLQSDAVFDQRTLVSISAYTCGCSLHQLLFHRVSVKFSVEMEILC